MIKVEIDVPEITYDLQQGQAIDFIFYKKAEKTFELNQQAIEEIVHQGGEKSIGKSFLFNQALDLDPRNNGFTHNQQGIKIWTEPFIKTEENLCVYFVDCEGFDDYDPYFKNFIWCLSFLTGSGIFYQTQGGIDANSFQNLNVLQQLIEKIQFSDEQNENQYIMSYYAPKFVWILRDYQIEEVDDYGYILEPDKYMEKQISLPLDPTIRNIQELFLNFFTNRSCLDFETPPYNQYPFENLHNQISDEFKDKISYFKEKIYSHSQSKFYDGINFNCHMTINFISCIITLFNNQQVINYQEILNMVMEQECEMNYQNSSDKYREILQNFFANRQEAVKNEDLFNFFQEARDAALEEFQIPEDIREKYVEYEEFLGKLLKYMADQEEKLSEINFAIATEFNEKLKNKILKQNENDIEQISVEGNSTDEYLKLLNRCSDQFINQQQGSEGYNIFVEMQIELLKKIFYQIQNTTDETQIKDEQLEKQKQELYESKNKLEELKQRYIDKRNQKNIELKKLQKINEEKIQEYQRIMKQNKEMETSIQDNDIQIKKQNEQIIDYQKNIEKLEKKRKKIFGCFQIYFIKVFYFNFFEISSNIFFIQLNNLFSKLFFDKFFLYLYSLFLFKSIITFFYGLLLLYLFNIPFLSFISNQLPLHGSDLLYFFLNDNFYFLTLISFQNIYFQLFFKIKSDFKVLLIILYLFLLFQL